MGAETRFWLRSGPELVWQDAPGLGAVFDPATGETHFLNELPAVILLAIDKTPVSFSALVERLGGGDEIDERAAAKILAALSLLETAELVESRSSATE